MAAQHRPAFCLREPAVTTTSTSATGRSIWSGVLIGVGVAAFLDETVFHQLLHWHHFYDKSTADIGLVSDGFFHAGGWLAIVAGLFLFADLQRRQAASRTRLWGGGFLGWGVFQLYDGLIQHKVFGLHQIRYHVDVLPYDVVWNVAGATGALIGLFLLRRVARESARTPR
jgi:uncharacterized membrane protein